VPPVPVTLPGLPVVEPVPEPGNIPLVEPVPLPGFEPGFAPGFIEGGELVPPGVVGTAPGRVGLPESSIRPSGGSIGPVHAATTPIRGVMNKQSGRFMENSWLQATTIRLNSRRQAGWREWTFATLQAGDRVPVRSDVYSRFSEAGSGILAWFRGARQICTAGSARFQDTRRAPSNRRRTRAGVQQSKRSARPDQPGE